MRMAPFEPAPFREVINKTYVDRQGFGKRTFVKLSCGHLVILEPSRDTGQKKMRCKQCREES